MEINSPNKKYREPINVFASDESSSQADSATEENEMNDFSSDENSSQIDSATEKNEMNDFSSDKNSSQTDSATEKNEMNDFSSDENSSQTDSATEKNEEESSDYLTTSEESEDTDDEIVQVKYGSLSGNYIISVNKEEGQITFHSLTDPQNTKLREIIGLQSPENETTDEEIENTPSESMGDEKRPIYRTLNYRPLFDPLEERKRNIFSENQTAILEATYESGKFYLSSDEVQKFSEDFEVSCDTIVTWFKNRRVRGKKSNSENINHPLVKRPKLEPKLEPTLDYL